MRGVIRQLRWLALFGGAVFTALFAAWHLLSAVNFLYPVWHKALHIEDTVRVYGPQNHNRHGFERTTPEEHARLFAAIVRGVENHGAGLEDIYYRDTDGHAIDRLLTAPEITHLRDVSRLIAALQIFGWSCALIFIAGFVSLRLKPAPAPRFKAFILYFSSCLLIGISGVLAIGAKKVFYKLHTWIFPPDHQWFFYYQDSLMTTLMKAPDLFAAIAAEWLLLTVLLALALLLGCKKALIGNTVPGAAVGGRQ